MRRAPAVAGQFYSFERSHLNQELKKCFSVSGEPGETGNQRRIVAAVAPHAGYDYSGMVAAFTYKALKEDRSIETAVVIGPNHTGLGAGVSVYPHGEWETPLGDVSVDSALAKKIIDDRFIGDEEGHTYEHSAEVQLPFLQHVYGESFRIVPICAMDQSIETMRALGKKLAAALDPAKHAVIASTDFSHYVQYDAAYKNDHIAIDAIKRLDDKALYAAIEKHGISMCGFGGVAAAIVYSRALGAKQAELLRYQTSGDVTRDRSHVVGYGSLIMTK